MATRGALGAVGNWGKGVLAVTRSSAEVHSHPAFHYPFHVSLVLGASGAATCKGTLQLYQER